MNPTPPETQTPGHRAWVAFRFLAFGVSGLLLMLVSSFALVFRIVEGDSQFGSPWLSLPFAIAGMLLLLFGLGEWKRPGYLLVFVSIPVSVAAICFATRHFAPQLGNSTVATVLILGVVVAIVYSAVEFYYSEKTERARKRARQSAEPSE